MLALLLTLTAIAAPAQDDASFAAVRAHVLPDESESAWKRLGWHASLWEGVVAAQAADKPILLWAMNGHPLGCT
jgi:hypothetical protein